MGSRIQHLWPVEPAGQISEPFRSHREAAIALLSGQYRLTRKAGQFLGQLAVDSAAMSDAQSGWLAALLRQHGLPTLAECQS